MSLVRNGHLFSRPSFSFFHRRFQSTVPVPSLWSQFSFVFSNQIQLSLFESSDCYGLVVCCVGLIMGRNSMSLATVLVNLMSHFVPLSLFLVTFGIYHHHLLVEPVVFYLHFCFNVINKGQPHHWRHAHREGPVSTVYRLLLWVRLIYIAVSHHWKNNGRKCKISKTMLTILKQTCQKCC